MMTATFRTLVTSLSITIATLVPAAAQTAPQPVPGLDRISHIFVIYLENRSFDHLYGLFPGAEGLAQAAGAPPQVDADGKPYAQLPAFRNHPQKAGAPTLDIPALPNKPFDLSAYMPIDRPLNADFEYSNKFYQSQQAIDGGRMDRYVAISGTPAFGYFDGSQLPMWRYAKEFVLADHFHQAAFGGTAMNHYFLFCACVPRWPDAPEKLFAQVSDDGKLIKDGYVTPDGYIVNNLPAPEIANQAPLQDMPHIGDRLDAAGISWTWYSGSWTVQKQQRSNRRPFLLFRNLTTGTPGEDLHVKDEDEFTTDLAKGTLPQVVFIKPKEDEHPSSQAGLLADDTHTAAMVKAIQDSPYWPGSLIIVTYDEGHSFWDHVPPPKGDRWGPGRRIPAIIVSPFARRGFIDHTQYDTTSILKLLETRFGLPPLGTRDASANDLTAALDLK